jgi:hypothetical protein
VKTAATATAVSTPAHIAALFTEHLVKSCRFFAS